MRTLEWKPGSESWPTDIDLFDVDTRDILAWLRRVNDNFEVYISGYAENDYPLKYHRLTFSNLSEAKAYAETLVRLETA